MEVETEDGQPLPAEAAAASLSLRVTPPGGSRSDAVVYSLPAAEEGEEEEAAPAAGVFAFPLTELTAAGAYSVVAEYREGRAELAPPAGGGGRKSEAPLRSSAVELAVGAGPPVTLALQAPALPTTVAVTNGPVCRRGASGRGR